MKFTSTYVKALLLSMFIGMVFTSYSQDKQLTREEIAIKKAEERLERARLKLVAVKRDIESADSLFVAGETLEQEASVVRAVAKDEIKAVKKQFKTDSKPAEKKTKSKDRELASQGRAELKEVTAKYKADLKIAETKYKNADRDIINAGRMMDKADKKLDLLKDKLKAAEKSYKEAEESLNDKKGTK